MDFGGGRYNMGMNIKAYNGKDKATVLQLFQLNTPKYFSVNEKNDYVYFLNHFIENYFVVECAGTVVGCGGFNIAEDGVTAKISWDIIHPDYHGKGIGTALTKYRIELIKKNPEIKFISVRTSQLVYPFIERFGLEIEEIIQDYWDIGFDMYKLSNTVECVKH